MRLGILTGSRAEYGLLEPLIQLFQIDEETDLQLYVTGSHLSPEFGYTADQIKFPITEKIECLLSSDTPVGVSKAMGLAIMGFAEAFERHRPEIIVLLGDRFEMVAGALAAHVARIPIAHIHGGEITAGVYDDAFRHSITKMGQLHFVAAEPYRKRVIQLGENPRTVFNVGALGCDGLEKRYNYKSTNIIIIALWNETFENEFNLEEIRDSIGKAIEEHHIRFCRIKPGADVGNSNMLHQITDKEENDYFIELSRGQYIDLLSKADCIFGNSSSGIIEAPALGVPTINIGNRQKGRLMADSIINCDPTKPSIEAAFDILYSDKFQAFMKTDYETPYKGVNVAVKIRDIIKRGFSSIEMKKGFYDRI